MLWEPTIDLNVFTIFNGNDQSDTFFKVCLEKKQNWANTNCCMYLANNFYFTLNIEEMTYYRSESDNWPIVVYIFSDGC